jgi:hypothetical protein
MARALALGAAIVAILAGASAALADPPAGHNPQGKMLGVVAPKGQGNKVTGGSALVYHGGPVMHTNTTYTIFWGPANHPFDPSYVSLINRFFGDVAHDSGLSTNVYSVGTQYSSILYSSSVGGSFADTNGYPASGCKDRYTSVCLTDAQLRAELQSVISAKGWPTDTGTAYFIFTPQNVGSCAGTCAFSSFCAYHSWINTSTGTILYANMPYAMWVPSACDSGQHPNGNDADATIDGASHEHNEMITDPVGTGWFTKNGYEQGDLCNFIYGPPVPGSPSTSSGAAYNQVIGKGSNPYWIQEEWSNSPSGCLQHLP